MVQDPGCHPGFHPRLGVLYLLQQSVSWRASGQPGKCLSLFDGFDDGTINTTLWTQTGTVTESGGWAHLSAGGDLYGTQPYTYGMLEMRIQTIAEGNLMWWGWEDGPADAPNFVVFEDYPTGLAALLRNDGAAYQTLTLTTQPAGGLIVPHTYATEWRPGLARWYTDGVQVQSASTGVPRYSDACEF